MKCLGESEDHTMDDTLRRDGDELPSEQTAVPTTGSPLLTPQLLSSTTTETLSPDDIAAISDAMVAFRFAGIQCRLYPDHPEFQLQAIQDALTALARLMEEGQLLTISFDGT